MRRALGKGLAQLLGESSESQVTELPLSSIEPNPDQPRQHFDEDALEELAESIRGVGILQPLVVRPLTEGRYALIAGERRWRASKLAGLTSVPVVVRNASEQDVLQLAIIENVQREDISPVEQAVAYRKLIDEFSLTQEQVAGAVGKSRVSVANALRLLRLPSEVREALTTKLITEGHARALLMCEDENALKSLFFRVVDEGLTVRDTERLARRQPAPIAKAEAPTKPRPAGSGLDPAWNAVGEAMSIYLGSPTKLQKADVGGKITIEFYSDDDLQRILDVLGIHP